ncbi:ROK family protein [Paenibacillus nasutitermitis]|uniref:Glucokinase n=1 Tax=Paenibacillus nasutitermitis TaxID=1652958 RepID=A0A917E007_9BACL|nr:ROK family protein [Paenibacillus nasutitermitis]GGD83098.1 glucokinase [Paenibacillus nasutitermitis]
MNITIDFGGTNIKIGLVEAGMVAAKKSIPAHSAGGLGSRLPDVERSVHELLAKAGVSLQQCSGIGLALPGIVDSKRKQVLSAIKDKYTDAAGFDFTHWTNSAFSLPLAMENDARAALIGEAAYGAARGAKDAVLVIFGTGIGTAAIMNGAIVRGSHYQAGILGGHLATDIYGETCLCGNVGCLEAQASHWAIPQRAGKIDGFSSSALARENPLGYEGVIKAYAEGDECARQLMDDLILHWSAGIVNLIHAYDPEVVVLSGGLMKSAAYLLPRVAERVLALAWTPWGTPRFEVAEDPEISVMLGLSHLLCEARRP